MQQMAAEKIRATQLANYCSGLTFCSRDCNDSAPEGFAEFVGKCLTSNHAGVHITIIKGPLTPGSPDFGVFDSLVGGEGGGLGKGTGSILDRVKGAPLQVRGRSSPDPLMGRVGTRSGRGGHGDDGGDDDKNGTMMVIEDIDNNKVGRMKRIHGLTCYSKW
eukprot:442547-Amphidinium_carterae.1